MPDSSYPGAPVRHQCGVEVFPHRFRHHFSHTWLDRGGAEGDLMELNGWTSPQMLRHYGASAPLSAKTRSARVALTSNAVVSGASFGTYSAHHPSDQGDESNRRVP